MKLLAWMVLLVLTIGQPAGFGAGSLLEVERVRIGVPLGANNGRDGVFHLTEVSISGATLNVIAKGQSTNLAAMKAQVDRQVVSSESPVTAMSDRRLRRPRFV